MWFVVSDFTLSDQVNATALRYPSDEKVPLVVMLFQGDLAQVYTIRQHLENRVPVILLEGCGYLADIMAYAVRERCVLSSVKSLNYAVVCTGSTS